MIAWKICTRYEFNEKESDHLKNTMSLQMQFANQKESRITANIFRKCEFKCVAVVLSKEIC